MSGPPSGRSPRAAGVDGGLVMHYFGSKQELFQRVTHDPPVQELTGTADDITEQILARLADSLANEPVQSLALLRSMLTHPDAAQAMREGAARYQAQISRPITADDAGLRAALVGAVMLGVILSRHLLRTEALSDASPEHVIDLLRPCLRSLTRAGPGPAADCNRLPGRRGHGRGPQAGTPPKPGRLHETGGQGPGKVVHAV